MPKKLHLKLLCLDVLTAYLLRRTSQMLADMRCDPGYKIETVSRLDQPTSGVLILPTSTMVRVSSCGEWRLRIGNTQYWVRCVRARSCLPSASKHTPCARRTNSVWFDMLASRNGLKAILQTCHQHSSEQVLVPVPWFDAFSRQD